MKIVTLNLRHDADRWTERFPLVVAALLAEDADVIAFQEVALLIDQAVRIVAELNSKQSGPLYELFQASKWGDQGHEGLALLSRLPVRDHFVLNLPQHSRVAQSIALGGDYSGMRIVNTHLHHMPLNEETIRLEQIRFLLDWMYQEQHKDQHWILVGDFNAKPGSESMAQVRAHLVSAYQEANGAEPDYTFPTPLVTGDEAWFEEKTLDYIFFDQAAFSVQEAHLVGDAPDKDDPSLYPSDHFGIAATITARN